MAVLFVIQACVIETDDSWFCSLIGVEKFERVVYADGLYISKIRCCDRIKAGLGMLLVLECFPLGMLW